MLIYCLIPIVFFITLFIIVYSNCRDTGIYTRTRLSYIYTTVISGLLLVLLTEGLSAGNHITLNGLLAAWSFPTVALTGYVVYKGLWRIVFREVPGNIFKPLKKSPMLSVIAGFLLISLFIALAYPPNNYDSLTYHMARVAHWKQNHSISHYPTHIIRQLEFPPFAEWIILHLQVLTGSDRLANAVQLFFFAGCLMNISLIIKTLGGDFRRQMLGAFFTCLIPMAVIQSNTTQNDLVVAYFVTCFVYFTIRMMKKVSPGLIMLAGISLGLSWLTKGTAYLFTILFTGWYALILLKDFQSPFKQIIKKTLLLAIIPAIAITINSGHYYRNNFLSGKPLGTSNSNTTNHGFKIKALALVSFKNFLNHMPVTREIKNRLVLICDQHGIDANDQDYNFMPTDWMTEGFNYHEDTVQNFIHTILFLVIGACFVFKKRLYNEPIGLYPLFVFTLYASVILFCVLLKWQPWSNRLETALFILFCVPLAMEIAEVNKWLQALCIVPMLGFAIPALIYSSKHPLLPPGHSIFMQPYNSFIYDDRIIEYKKYLDSRPYKKIGLYLGADNVDYSFYKLLAGRDHEDRIIKHIMVNNESAIYLDDFVPDVIIGINQDMATAVIGGQTYYRVMLSKDGPAIFERR